jgi:methionyl-tRNA formyltransferase
VLNWALINDEPSFGVTIHYVDEGIDTGDIILQRHEPISDADTYARLLERAIVACAELLHDALIRIATGSATRTPQSQIAPVGVYFGRRRMGDEWIDWNWPSRRIFNFVRAISAPGPRALTMIDDQALHIDRATLIPGAPNYLATPGEIVGVDPRCVIVKTGDSTIALDRPENASVRLHIGKRLVSKPDIELAQLRVKVADLEAQIRRLELERKAEIRG